MANCSWVEQLDISTWLNILVNWSYYSFSLTLLFKQESKESVMLKGSYGSVLNKGLGPVAQAGITGSFSFQQDGYAHWAVRVSSISVVFNPF